MQNLENEKYINNSPIPVNIERTEIILKQMRKCVCKIHKEDGNKGTGFFCNIPYPDDNHLLPVLITNDHVLNLNYIENYKKILFSINNEKKYIPINIDSSRKIFNDKDLDMTFIEIKKDKDEIKDLDFLEIDVNIRTNKNYLETIYAKKSIYILNYPEDNKEVVVSYGLLKEIREEKIYHLCSTEGGSSGSPIISLENNKVIGIHKGSKTTNNFNIGNLINYGLNKFNEKSMNKSNNSQINTNILNNPEIGIDCIYKIDKQKKIKIFGDIFVDNNKDNCTIFLEGNEQEICNEIDILEKFQKENELHIKIKINKKIKNMRSMFARCSSLKSVSNFSILDTSEVECLKSIFFKCSSLSEIKGLSNWNTESVNDMSNLFFGCSSLKSIPYICKWNTKKVKDMSNLFGQCSSLIYLPDISKWDMGAVTNISNIFCGCSSLKTLPDISKWNTSNISNMKGIFDGCESLIAIPNISIWNTSNAIDMSYMFGDNKYKSCSLLTELPDISKWDTSKVEDMTGMFYGCKSLKSLPDISKWKKKKGLKYKYMFRECQKSLKIPEKFK